MSYVLEGKITRIFEKQKFDSGFQKQEIVITTQEKYPQEVKVEFVKDNIEKLAQHKLGNDVLVRFNLRGNEYQGKYYVSIQGWDIKAADTQNAVSEEKETETDLPF